MARRDVLRLLLGALTLAGLLAMHGFAAHGTGLTEPEAAGTTVVHAADHESDAAGTGQASGHDGHGAAALCLALLVVGFTLAALMRARPWRGLTLRRVPAPATWAPYHRAADPPDLSSLCVLRC